MNGKDLELKIGCSYRIDNRDMVYAGMVNPDTFSIVHQYEPFENCGLAYNLYFPVKTRTFNLEESVFEVINVKPMSIIIRSLGRGKDSSSN